MVKGHARSNFTVTSSGFPSRSTLKLHGVADEFSLRHLGHQHALAFQLDHAVARDGMTVDREDDVADLQHARPQTPARRDAGDDHAAVVFREPKRLAHARD